MDDETLAHRLMEQKYIRAYEYDVWLRNRHGASVYSMRRDYPNECRPGKFFYETTLRAWIDKVNQALCDARLITSDPEEIDEAERNKIAVAQGSDVHDASNPTPQLRVVTEECSWDTDRLLAAGVLDRYSRKRA